MALWGKVKYLDEDRRKQLYEYYKENIPIEIRELFAFFIEDVILGKKLKAENPNHSALICEFIDSLITQIENKANAENIDSLRLTLTDTADKFKKHFGSNKIELFKIIKECIHNDMDFVGLDEFLIDCESLKNKLRTRVATLNILEQKQNDFQCAMNNANQFLAHISKLKENATVHNVGEYAEQLKLAETKQQKLQTKILENVRRIIGNMAHLEDQFAQDLGSLLALQNQILHELSFWKFEQQKIANGSIGTLHLHKLKLWCEEVTEIIWNLRVQLKRAEKIKVVNPVFTQCRDRIHPDTISELIQKMTSLLGELLQEAFVIIKQPPQVVKQTVNISNGITICHLAVHKLQLHMEEATVSVRFIDESMAKILKTPNRLIQDYPGMKIHPKVLQYNNELQMFTTTFSKWEWNGFKRPQHRAGGSERVLEDKFALYFETVISIAEMEFKLWTISLPIVVSSHGSQDDIGAATILWDNGFGEMNREPFVVPKSVPWADLSVVLHQYFESVTGKGLTQENIRTLETKLFRGSLSRNVTWSKFCKDNMVGKNLSFWNWCFEAIKLIEKNFKGPWTDGSIYGIIERDEAERLLSTCRLGTFLIRFSDSKAGAISITCVYKDFRVVHTDPTEKKDLNTLGFVKLIMKMPHLKFLYPDIPKEKAFGQYLTASPSSPYVGLLTTLDIAEIENADLPASSSANDENNPLTASPNVDNSTPSQLPSQLMDTDPPAFATDDQNSNFQNPSFEINFQNFLTPILQFSHLNTEFQNLVQEIYNEEQTFQNPIQEFQYPFHTFQNEVQEYPNSIPALPNHATETDITQRNTLPPFDQIREDVHFMSLN